MIQSGLFWCWFQTRFHFVFFVASVELVCFDRDGPGTFLPQGLESHCSESRDCPNDFCPSPKSPRDLCPMERLWDSQNSWDCLGLESQEQSRDFGFFFEKTWFTRALSETRQNKVPQLTFIRIGTSKIDTSPNWHFPQFALASGLDTPTAGSRSWPIFRIFLFAIIQKLRNLSNRIFRVKLP